MFFGKDKGRGISAIVMSIASLLFAEIIPKIIALSNPESICLKTTYLMRFLLIICLPVNYILDYITPLLRKKFSPKTKEP